MSMIFVSMFAEYWNSFYTAENYHKKDIYVNKTFLKAVMEYKDNKGVQY